MSKYSDFRIIEQYKFFIQEKFYYFGKNYKWIYKYDPDVYEGFQGFCGILAAILFVIAITLLIVSFFTHINYWSWIIPLSLSVFFILALIKSMYSKKEEFDSFKIAQNRIDRKIDIRKEDKEKRNEIREKNKNKKIHYLDIKT